MKFTTENRGEKLWVPSGTKAQEHKEYVEKFYGDSSSRIQIFQLTAPESGNVLTPEAFDAALSIHMKVSKVEAPDPKDTSSLVTWENYCLKRGDRCTSWSILAQFGYNNTLWQSENAILNAINGFFRPVAEAGDGQACKTTEGGFEITQLLGGIERDTESGNVTSAKLLSFGYLLQNNLELTDDNSETDPKVSNLGAGTMLRQRQKACAS